VLLFVAQFNGQERAQAFISFPPSVEWLEVMPRAHDAQPLPVDNDPFEVDWLAINDESEQASRLAGKKLVVAPNEEKGPDLTGSLLR
jgi:hypothetical protein